MRITEPDNEDKREMAGRMYEACDIQMAIEKGHLVTIEDVLKRVKESQKGLSQLLELPKWAVNDSCCVDTKASIEHNSK